MRFTHQLLLVCSLVPFLLAESRADNVSIDDGDWFDSDNWSQGSVPSAGDGQVVIIKDGYAISLGTGSATTGLDLKVGDTTQGNFSTSGGGNKAN